ncbi:MAG: hypothetical protein CBD98_001175 [Flavobacteriaceae bacterium TMED238]|nr:MAG: hypothetical protein CBD98_001175 [Flavobacteriaceae bacterium TMED238]
MEQNLNKKIEFKAKFISFLKENKKKSIFSILILLIFIISTAFITINNEKKNVLISEKYIQAGLYLASNKLEKSKNIYEEIILSKNKSYSILSLNTILEKNLETDKNKILNYFKIIEELDNSEEQKDLVIFKKALFLINESDIEEGKKLLNDIIESNSKLKSLAEEILAK